jgi:O-antigen/teichoic acid export membrane protein
MPCRLQEESPRANDERVIKRLLAFGRDSTIYGLAGAVNKFFTLLTFPILARSLSIADYGLVDYLNTFGTLLLILAVQGQDAATARSLHDPLELDDKKQLATASFIFQILLSSLISLITIGLAARVANQSDGNGAIFKAIVYLALSLPFLTATNFSLNLLKWTFKRRGFLFISLGSTALNCAALVALAYSDKLTVDSYFLTYLITRIVFGACAIWLTADWLSYPQDLSNFFKSFSFALPLGLLCAVAGLSPVIERGIITSILGTEQLGLFAAGAKVASILALFTFAIELSWQPFALSIAKEPEAEKVYSVALTTLTSILTIISLLAAAFAIPAIKFLGSAQYAAAHTVVLPLSLSLSVASFSNLTSTGLLLAKNSLSKLKAYIIATTAYICLAIPFTYFRGFEGTAWAALLTVSLRAYLETAYSQRFYSLNWNLKTPCLIILSATICALAELAFPGLLLVRNINLLPLLAAIGIILASWKACDKATRGRVANYIFKLRAYSKTRN